MGLSAARIITNSPTLSSVRTPSSCRSRTTGIAWQPHDWRRARASSTGSSGDATTNSRRIAAPTLAPTDPLARAVELILAGFQQDFPVVERDVVVGVLTRRDLLKVLAERGEHASVGTSMRRDFQLATADEPVEEALARLQESGSHAIPVVRGRRLLGMLTVDNVGEYVMIRRALRSRPI